jgi:ribosome maturation factor RimP
MGSFGNSTRESLENVAREVAAMPQFADVEFLRVTVRRERGTHVISIMIDRDGGVGTALCEEVSRSLIRRVEELAYVVDYRVEVSSAGLDRPLEGHEQFRRFIGKKARAITTLRIANRTEFAGRIATVTADAVTIEDPYAGPTPLPYAAIKRAHLVYDPTADLKRKATEDRSG